MYVERKKKKKNVEGKGNTHLVNSQNAPSPQQTPPAAYVTANSKDGFAIKSADGDYSLKIGGYTQVLSRDFGSSDKEDLQTNHGSTTSYDEDDAILESISRMARRLRRSLAKRRFLPSAESPATRARLI